MYNQRKHNEKKIVSRRIKRMKYVFLYAPGTSDETIAKDKGISRKTKPWDCGIPGCRLCANPRRVWGDLTIKEETSILNKREMLEEYYLEE